MPLGCRTLKNSQFKFILWVFNRWHMIDFIDQLLRVWFSCSRNRPEIKSQENDTRQVFVDRWQIFCWPILLGDKIGQLYWLSDITFSYQHVLRGTVLLSSTDLSAAASAAAVSSCLVWGSCRVPALDCCCWVESDCCWWTDATFLFRTSLIVLFPIMSSLSHTSPVVATSCSWNRWTTCSLHIS